MELIQTSAEAWERLWPSAVGVKVIWASALALALALAWAQSEANKHSSSVIGAVKLCFTLGLHNLTRNPTERPNKSSPHGCFLQRSLLKVSTFFIVAASVPAIPFSLTCLCLLHLISSLFSETLRVKHQSFTVDKRCSTKVIMCRSQFIKKNTNPCGARCQKKTDLSVRGVCTTLMFLPLFVTDAVKAPLTAAWTVRMFSCAVTEKQLRFGDSD